MNNNPPLSGPAPISGGTTTPARPAVTGAPQQLGLQFTGTANEYFRIWIVNTCLTLLTLGIFSAWAKVRKKRYFYSHTRLDGTPFQYLGQPIPILKGRLIAAGLFAVWYAATHYVTILLPFVLVAAFLLAPWVVVRAAAFNARYSAFRNMTFSFTGTYLGAAKIMYGWAIVTLLTLGIAFSWWAQRMKRFMVRHMAYGGIDGEFTASGGQFFKTYLIAGLLFIGAVFGISMLSGAGIALAGKSNSTIITVIVLIVMYSIYVMVYAYAQARITNLVWNSTQLGPVNFVSTIGARGLLGLYVTNALGILLSAGLLIPWATIRTLKYRADHFSVVATGDLNQLEGGDDSNVRAAGAEVGEFFDFDMSI
ncbi:MAG: YjgN family protein [Gammaproteobacteria bacterium]|nr:YjgN family protein [Gammaproteobacteria bacterium]